MCKNKLLLILGLVACCLLVGCKSSKLPVEKEKPADCLSAKVELVVPTKDALFTVNGTLKMIGGERVQLSFLMPILRSEVARVEVTPNELLLVDRMGHRYVRTNRDELKGMLPKDATFDKLEKLIKEAAQPNGRRTLTGSELGIPSLNKGKITLSDFSTAPFTLTPTQLSDRYTQVSLQEILQLLLSL